MSLNLEPMPQRAPSWWSPLLDADTLRGLALRAAQRVADNNPALQPVAATVTGSRLSGLDHADSDVDVLVLTANRCKPRTLKPVTDPVTGLPTEGQVQSLFAFTELLSESVPHNQAHQSPVFMVDPRYAPFLRAARGGAFTLTQHAQRFAHHAATRAQCPTHKAARLAHCAYAMARGLPGLLDRDAAQPGSPRSHEVATWLTDYSYYRREADLARGLDRPDDLPRALAVAEYLRTSTV